MGTAAAAIITAAVAATAAVAKGVRAAKDRKERKVQQGKVQDQLTETKGNYEAYRRDAATDRANVMHASMEMYEPVFKQMEAMYGEGGYKRPDFEAAMRMNESRSNEGGPGKESRPIKQSRPDPASRVNQADKDKEYIAQTRGGEEQHTTSTSGTMDKKAIESSRGGGDVKHPLDSTGQYGGGH